MNVPALKSDCYLAEIAELRDRIEELEEENRQFREAFCSPLPLLWHLGLAVTESSLLAALYRSSGVLTKRGCYVAMHGLDGEVTEKGVDVYICKLRKKLGPHGIVIETIHTTGYRLQEGSHMKVRALVGDEPRQIEKFIRRLTVAR